MRLPSNSENVLTFNGGTGSETPCSSIATNVNIASTALLLTEPCWNISTPKPFNLIMSFS